MMRVVGATYVVHMTVKRGDIYSTLFGFYKLLVFAVEVTMSPLSCIFACVDMIPDSAAGGVAGWTRGRVIALRLFGICAGVVVLGIRGGR